MIFGLLMTGCIFAACFYLISVCETTPSPQTKRMKRLRNLRLNTQEDREQYVQAIAEERQFVLNELEKYEDLKKPL